MKKWILRFLFIILFLIAGAFLFLNIISGEGESQRRGLEGAFAQVFQGETTIGKLNNFNILPQFIVNTENIAVNHKDGNITAEKVIVAFAFTDILTKTNRIEDINLTNVNIDKGILGKYPIHLNKIMIEKDKAKLTIDGEINSKKINAQVDLIKFDGERPSFALGKNNNFILNIGDIKTTGVIIPYRADIEMFNNITLTGFGKNCALTDKNINDDIFLNTILISQLTISSPAGFDKLCNDFKNHIVVK